MINDDVDQTILFEPRLVLFYCKFYLFYDYITYTVLIT